jgi:uncharacterized membrane protein YtjA (UPF0391 family)
MLQAAISLFIFGIIAFALGAYNIAGASVELGKTLFLVFIALSVISFISNLFLRDRSNDHKTLP